MRINRVALVLLTLILLAPSGRAQTQTSYEIVFEPDVVMKTRDGVALRADIYRPKSFSGDLPWDYGLRLSR